MFLISKARPGCCQAVVLQFWIDSMLRVFSSLLRLRSAWLILLLGAGPMPSVQAQAKPIPAGQGAERLTMEKDWRTDQSELREFQALRRGDRPVGGKETDQILDHGAQWFAYRFTHSEHQMGKSGFKSMQELRREVFDQIIDPRGKPVAGNQQVFMEEFGKRLTARLQEVSKNPKPIARLNAVMVLAHLAATGQEQAADVLAEVIQDPKENDAIKLFAFRGLRELFALGHGENPIQFKNKEREGRCIVALLDYLNRKPNIREGAAADELAAIPFVRSEAVAALGETRYPAITREIDKKTKAVERRTALALLRMMRKDGVPAGAALKEQVAAAVGLCQLQANLCEEYQPDYTAFQIGKFIVEFATRFNNESMQKKEPWKIDAARLSNGLNQLKSDKMDSQVAQYVAKLADQAESVLKAIVAGNLQPNPAELESWLQANPPKSRTVYRGIQDAVVRDGGKPAE